MFHEHDMGRLDDREISFNTSLCARLYLFSGRVWVGGWVVGGWFMGRVQRGGGCTVEMSCLLGGEVRQEDQMAGTMFLYGVSHFLFS